MPSSPVPVISRPVNDVPVRLTQQPPAWCSGATADPSPTTGTLSYLGVLGDFRKYFLPVRPFTIATRIMHYGRYGTGGESDRLQPLFLGTPGLIRGYSYGSFSSSECTASVSNPTACPVFDQLLGSRMIVANAELRFPLFGALGVGSGYYGVFPLELAVFGD